MSQKPLYQKLRQVALTYLTWRWTWFIIPLMLVMVLPGILSDETQTAAMSLGMPSMMGLIWIVAVVKWQFVNPRARLLPGYAQSHLLVFGIFLLLAYVLSPLVFSFRHGLIPWGPLAFTLLLGGCALIAFLLGRGLFIVPAIAIFFSGITEQTHTFWFGASATYSAIHIPLVLVGGGIMSYCLWYMAQLTEEMNEYQVLPIGGIQTSRVERAEQRKFLGRQIKKQKLFGWFSDRWLDRGFAITPNVDPTATLIQYGIARSSGIVQACYTGVGFALYGIAMMQFPFFRDGDSSAILDRPRAMFFVFAMILPTAIAGLTLLQHRTRMAQELLRPATRNHYLSSLLFTLAKTSLLLWMGIFAGLFFLAYTTDTLPKENTTALILKYSALSFAVQIPAFGLCLRMALWNSQFGYMFGMYAVIGLQMAVLLLWWRNQESWTWPIITLVVLVHFVVGAGILVLARNAWRRTELA